MSQFSIVQPFVDMDGVLFNFKKGCRKVYKDFPEGMLPEKEFQQYRSKLYAAIAQTPDFFLNLEPLPDYDYLYNSLLEMGCKPYILTAVPSHLSLTEPEGRHVAKQKRDCILKHFGPEAAERTIVTKAHLKQEFIMKEKLSVLIDDLNSNIYRWNQAGGLGILHTNPKDSIARLAWHLRP